MDRPKGGLSCVLFAKCLLFKRIITKLKPYQYEDISKHQSQRGRW